MGRNADGDGKIEFKEFVQWYIENRFNDDVLLTVEERLVRDLAKKYETSTQEIENLQKLFAIQAASARGFLQLTPRKSRPGQGKGHKTRHEVQDLASVCLITPIEFKELLYNIMKVPPGVELPASRLGYYWRAIDKDQSGFVNFEEFLAWWMKDRSSLTPYEDFYRRLRPVIGLGFTACHGCPKKENPKDGKEKAEI